MHTGRYFGMMIVDRATTETNVFCDLGSRSCDVTMPRFDTPVVLKSILCP